MRKLAQEFPGAFEPDASLFTDPPGTQDLRPAGRAGLRCRGSFPPRGAARARGQSAMSRAGAAERGERPRPSDHSQPNTAVAARGPATWARMNPGASPGAMPEKVSVNERATVAAGFANEVDEVNQ